MNIWSRWGQHGRRQIGLCLEAVFASFRCTVLQNRAATHSLFQPGQWSAIAGNGRHSTRERTCLPWGPGSRMLLRLLWCSHAVWLNTWWEPVVASWTWFDTLINLEKCSHFHPIRKVLEKPSAMCLCCCQQIMPVGSFLFINNFLFIAWPACFRITPVCCSFMGKGCHRKWMLPTPGTKEGLEIFQETQMPRATLWCFLFSGLVSLCSLAVIPCIYLACCRNTCLCVLRSSAGLCGRGAGEHGFLEPKNSVLQEKRLYEVLRMAWAFF